MTFVSLKLCSGVNIGLGFNNPKSCNEKHYSSLVVLLGKESPKKFANSTVPSFLSLKMLLWAWDQNKNKEKVLSCRVQLNVQRALGVNLVLSMLDWKHPLLCKVSKRSQPHMGDGLKRWVFPQRPNRFQILHLKHSRNTGFRTLRSTFIV